MKHLKLYFIFWYSLIFLWIKSRSIVAIVGGSLTKNNEFKSVVSIQVNNEHICGGTIIGKHHILTAAHCVINDDGNFKDKKLTILAGVDHLRTATPPGIRIDVHAVYVPDAYIPIKREPRVYYYPDIADIAILKLKHGFEFDVHQNVELLPLPKKASSRFFKKSAVFVGFGTDYANRGIKRNNDNVVTEHRYSNVIKVAETTIIHKNMCKSMYLFEIHENHICAQVIQRESGVPEGVCHGDDGGPLILDGQVIGVLSQTRHDCNEKYDASIYTRVSNYKKFINNALGDNRFSNLRTALYKKNENDQTEHLVEYSKRDILDNKL